MASEDAIIGFFGVESVWTWGEGWVSEPVVEMFW